MLELQARDWEQQLLSFAYEGRQSAKSTGVVFSYKKELLERSYLYCEQVTAHNSRSFYLASKLLPLDKRRATRALYAFCRTTDDIVDHPDGNIRKNLEQWRQRSLSWSPPSTDLAAIAWADARARYQIPTRYAEQLIDGVARDLHQTRYQTFEDLASYCYGVASTVGLMSMHITGFASEAAIPYAIKLGVALQLTNILRDVAEDWERDRLYLAQAELDAFGLTETDIERGVVTNRWRTFMKFQIERTRRLYQEAWPGIAMLAPEGQLAIAAAADFYREILKDIEAHDYDVFSRRAHISGWAKLRRLPGLWWQIRQANNAHKTKNRPSPVCDAVPLE